MDASQPESLLAAIARLADDADRAVKSCIKNGIDGRQRALYEGAHAAHQADHHALTTVIAELVVRHNEAALVGKTGQADGLAFAIKRLGGSL